jgi:mannose-6-phosphate isomerase
VTAALPTRSVAKPWGRDVLPSPFTAPKGERIGEIWFEPPAALDQLLVKYIFTSERLSIQDHPSDAQTMAAGLGRQGKEECWLVIHADPGATLGIGFKREIEPEAMRSAALDGSIEHLLEWHQVSAGDFYYIPANTVHAIGAGVSLIEVQQNSDITYRLYDYGRPRELHLDQGIAVAKGGVYPADLHRHVTDRGEVSLVEGPMFRLDRLDGPASAAVSARYGERPLLVIPRNAGIEIGGEALVSGECGLAPSLADVTFGVGSLSLIAQPV